MGVSDEREECPNLRQSTRQKLSTVPLGARRSGGALHTEQDSSRPQGADSRADHAQIERRGDRHEVEERADRHGADQGEFGDEFQPVEGVFHHGVLRWLAALKMVVSVET
jgi:hypothetical protein